MTLILPPRVPSRPPRPSAPEAAATSRRPPRGRRAAGIAVLSLVVAAAAMVEASIASGPNVNAVAGAVAAIDRAHAGAAVMVSPSSKVAAAVVAAEDGSFYSNAGVDVPGVLRGLWGFVTGSDAGGSTLEIQLSHLAFPDQTSGFWGRVHRVTLAVQMDTHLTKTAILSMYLDAAYFGHGFWGVQAASIGYFGVTPARLNWDQAALVAGLVQAPSQLDPVLHPQAALRRRGYVLQRLIDAGILSHAQADTLGAAPLQLA